MIRKFVAGTGWKMNHTVADARAYAARLRDLLAGRDLSRLDMFVLPPFTALAAAQEAFAGSPVLHGGQNVHWDDRGNWTGEISPPMLAELGCKVVALAHSERLAHFAETYPLVRKKLDAALRHGLTPVLCLGETADDKAMGASDAALRDQVLTALAGQTAATVPDVILAYEPRWAIGAAEAASPDYVAERHAALRALLVAEYGAGTAARTRIIYGGSVTPQNGPALVAQPEVDGLFVGRAAWTPEGFAQIVEIVAEAAKAKEGTLA